MKKAVFLVIISIIPIRSSYANLFWATDVVNSQLARDFVNKVAPKEESSIAVLDTGLDKKQIEHLQGALEVEVHAPSNTKVGELTVDENGHGTMVSSVIVGPNKMAVAEKVNFHFYRITGSGAEGKTNDNIINQALQEACEKHLDPNGVTIINLSWGSRLDEGGWLRDEDDKEKSAILSRLKKMGCLIVQAAGNSSFRKDYKTNLDDSILRVGAIDQSGQLALFSTSGEVSAPGQDVLVLESTTLQVPSKALSQFPDKDLSSPVRQVNGTSFASPLTAGIAGQVVRVLKTSPNFGDLRPEERIVLLNRILKASEIASTVNSLRAVKIAYQWVLKKSGAILLAEDLKNLVETSNDHVCNVKTSIENSVLRAQVDLCPLLRFSSSFALASTFLKQKNLPMANKYLRIARQDNNKSQSNQIEKLSMAFFEELIKFDGIDLSQMSFETNLANLPFILSKINSNMLLNELSVYLESCQKLKNCKTLFIKNAFIGALSQSNVLDRMSIGIDTISGEDRGSLMYSQMIGQIFFQVLPIIGENEVKKSIQIIYECQLFWDKKHKEELLANKEEADRELLLRKGYSVETLASFLRIIDSVFKNTKSSNISATLKNFLLNIENQSLNMAMSVNGRFKKTTDQFTPMEFFPVRSIYYNALERHQEVLNKALLQNQVNKLPALMAQYLIERKTVAMDVEERIQILFQLLESLINQHSWGEENIVEVFNLTWIMLNQTAKNDPNYRLSIRGRFTHFIEGLADQLLLSRLTISVFSRNLDEWTKNNFLNRDLKILMLTSLSQGLLEISDEELKAISSSVDLFDDGLLRYLDRKLNLLTQSYVLQNTPQKMQSYSKLIEDYTSTLLRVTRIERSSDSKLNLLTSLLERSIQSNQKLKVSFISQRWYRDAKKTKEVIDQAIGMEFKQLRRSNLEELSQVLRRAMVERLNRYP